MQICICGWYFRSECLQPFLNHDSFVVAHREGDSFGIPCTVIENVGLEFHCYDYFVKNIWDKKSDVLFCHDDLIVKDSLFLNDLEKVNDDIVMVWEDEKQYKRNLAHGRMFKCSAKYLDCSGGFWWDKDNAGCLNASEGCNKGIETLYSLKKRIMKNFYTDKVAMGFRGNIHA